MQIYCLGVDTAFNRNEYQEYILGGKSGQCLGPTTLPPFHVPTDMKSWSFTFLEPSGPIQPFPGPKRDFFPFAFNILYCAYSFWRSSVKREMELCYKFDWYWFPIWDNLIHMSHFGKMRYKRLLQIFETVGFISYQVM